MIMPNTERSVTANVRESLTHMVGQTTVAQEIAIKTGEKVGNVSASMHKLATEGRLTKEKKNGHAVIYLVLPSISKPRPADARARQKGRIVGSQNGVNERTGAGMGFKVEKDVKLPCAAPTTVVYPFASMKKGDSFRFPCKDKKEAKRVKNASYNFGRKHNKKFVVHPVGEGKRFARCWRTA